MAFFQRFCYLFPLLFLFSGCAKVPVVEGRIDQDFLDKLEKSIEKSPTIILSSGGGEVLKAFEAAKVLDSANVTIIVDDNCSSACAEDLLPAGKDIIFRNSPLIGFHWNSFMNRSQMVRFGGDVSSCSSVGLANQKYIYGLKGLNVDFWRETEARLDLQFYQVVPNGKLCPNKRRKFKNYLWLPDSQHIRKKWGLKFKGSVCADNFEKCKGKVDAKWKKGTRVVIGERIYVSEGIN